MHGFNAAIWGFPIGSLVQLTLGTATLGLFLGDTVLLSQPLGFLQQAPGAFVALGLLLGVMNLFGRSSAS